MDHVDMSAPPSEPTQPTPRRRRWLLGPAIFSLVVLLVGIGVTVWVSGIVSCEALQQQPSCNVALLPGPAEAVDDLIEVGAPRTFGSEGELIVTTIVVDSRLTVLEYVMGLRDASTDVVDREAIYPQGQTVEDARVENEILMSDSQLTAKVAALNHLGVDLEALTAGAEVVTVLPDTPGEEADLAAGDVITAVDGVEVGDADAAVAEIGRLEPGDEVVLRLGDGDEARDVTVELASNPDDAQRPYVGVLLRDYQVLPYDIDIEAGAIGGPSAGLVFSLGIVDRLTEDDLTDGRVIAGTGTITTDGLVGPIGGIVQKVSGAAERDEPASVFLVPQGNWDAAITARPGREVTLVPVATLDQAVGALEALAADTIPDDAVVVGPDGLSAA